MRWTKFRHALKKEQQTDPVTGSRLSPTANCHHLDLDENHYEDLSDKSHFIMLNKTTHDTVHFLWQAHIGWRKAVLNLIAILKRMEHLNLDPNS